MMSFLNRLGPVALLAGAVFLSGFFLGRMSGREVTLRDALVAFQNREKINNDVQNLSPVELCIALGGVPDLCASFVHGLDKAAPCQ